MGCYSFFFSWEVPLVLFHFRGRSPPSCYVGGPTPLLRGGSTPLFSVPCPYAITNFCTSSDLVLRCLRISRWSLFFSQARRLFSRRNVMACPPRIIIFFA